MTILRSTKGLAVFPVDARALGVCAAMGDRLYTSLAQLMDEIGKRAGQDFGPSADGVVTLEIDGTAVSVESPNDSAFVYFHAPVRRLSSKPLADLEAAMRLNLFALALSGSWLALDPASEELLLCYSAQLGALDADKVLAVVEAMADTVRSLRHADRPETEYFDPQSADMQNFLRV